MDPLGVLRGTFEGPGAPTMTQSRRGLEHRLGDLLPPDLDAGTLAERELLTASGDLTEEVLDLCAEHAVPEATLTNHWSYTRVPAEQEERAVFDVLRRKLAKVYTRGRRRLVKNVSGELSRLRKVWDGRRRCPLPVHLAMQIDKDHPDYRRTVDEPEDIDPDDHHDTDGT